MPTLGEVTDTVRADHPAKFSAPVLDKIRERIEAYRDGRLVWVVDPFAGVGGIHDLAVPHHVHTVAVEIEREWADAASVYAESRLGDAWMDCAATACDDARNIGRILISLRNVPPVLATSPCYGNRMADRYRGQNDTCTACGGSGLGPDTPLGIGEQTSLCAPCSGTGRAASRRYTYSTALGRDPAPGSSAALQWGPAYRTMHQEVMAEVSDVVGDLALINISDHIRGGEEQGVHLWWASLMGELGWTLDRPWPIRTRRNGNGANREVRVPVEWVLEFRR